MIWVGYISIFYPTLSKAIYFVTLLFISSFFTHCALFPSRVKIYLHSYPYFCLVFDAPKVRIPIRTFGSSKCDSHFLLDFGHFTVHTTVRIFNKFLSSLLIVAFALPEMINYLLQERWSDEPWQNLYSRFLISGRDIAAFFTDCGSECQNCTLVLQKYSSH
jgi:hypothetical protein